MSLSTRTKRQNIQNKSAKLGMLSMIILDIVAIISILSLVLLGDFFEQQNSREIDNTGKEVVCSYGQCFFIENDINRPYLRQTYETQELARPGS